MSFWWSTNLCPPPPLPCTLPPPPSRIQITAEMDRVPDVLIMDYLAAKFAGKGFHAMILRKYPGLLFTSVMDVLEWINSRGVKRSYAEQIPTPDDLPADCVVWQRDRVNNGRCRRDIYIYHDGVVFRSKKSFRDANAVVTIVD